MQIKSILHLHCNIQNTISHLFNPGKQMLCEGSKKDESTAAERLECHWRCTILKEGERREKEMGKKRESRNGRNIISSHSVHGSYLHRMQRGHILLNIPAVQSEKHEQIKDTAHLCLYFYTMKNLFFVWHYPSPSFMVV